MYCPELIKRMYLVGEWSFGKFNPPWLIYKYFLSFLMKIKMNVVQNAEIIEATKKFKIIINSHGIGSFSNNALIMINELVSNGYIVLTTTHNEPILPNLGLNTLLIFQYNFFFS